MDEFIRLAVFMYVSTMVTHMHLEDIDPILLLLTAKLESLMPGEVASL